MAVAIGVLSLLILLAVGAPIFIALLLSGSIGLFLSNGWDILINQLTLVPFRSVASGTLATIPLFILMGELINVGGIARQLFVCAQRILGRIPAGVAISTVIANAAFGSISGSSTAAAGTFSKVAVPEFKRMGYNMSAATGVIAVAGTLAPMIPPSTVLVLYGIITENSIGKLLLAGFVPGILTALVYSIGLVLWAKRDPKALPRGERYNLKEKLQSLKDVWGFLIVAGSVIISLYTGFATATEIAGIGAGTALLLLIVTRKINFQQLVTALTNTVKTFTMIMSIIFGAMVFSYFLAINRVPQAIISLIENSGIPPFGILLVVLLVYLILGCFMDQMAILIITLPLSYPLITSLGFDPIWYGILMVQMVEIGLITPPMGLNVYVTAGACGIPAETVFKGTGYMLIFNAVALIIMLAFPEIVLYVPYTLMK